MFNEKSASGPRGPSFIPNSYQTPNILVDQIMPLLTPQEWVVLSFAVRHILGWQDKISSRQAAISLSRFLECGLCKAAVLTALEPLCTYRLLRKIGEPSEKGQVWELCFDENIDFDGLKQRLELKQQKSTARTQAARVSRSVGQTGGGLSDRPEVVSGTDGIKHKSQTQDQTHPLPLTTFGGKSAGAPPSVASLVLNADPLNKAQANAKSAKPANNTTPAKAKAPVSLSVSSTSNNADSWTETTRLPLPTPPKVPQKGAPPDKPADIPPTPPDVEDKLLLLCFGSLDARNVPTNMRQIRKAYKDLYPHEPLTADRIDVFKVRWYAQDFRGKDGDRPMPHWVTGEWIKLMRAPDSDPENPYTDDYFWRDDGEDEVYEPAPTWPPEGCSVPRGLLTCWEGTLGHFRVVLNAPTFASYLGHAKLIHFTGDDSSGILYISAPNGYVKESIDRHLMNSLRKVFQSIARCEYQIEVVVDGDPIPGFGIVPMGEPQEAINV